MSSQLFGELVYGSRMTALLASDDPGRRLHWLHELKNHGYLVLSAPDLESAENLLATFQIDLAIVALSDERDHRALVKFCRNREQRIPILVPGKNASYEALDLARFQNVALAEPAC